MERCEDVLRETRNKIRISEAVEESFWTGRGVIQGCPLSSYMFNLLTADLEEDMRKGSWEGVRLGWEKNVYAGVCR